MPAPASAPASCAASWYSWPLRCRWSGCSSATSAPSSALSPSAQGIVDANGTLLPFDRKVFLAMAHPEDTAAVLHALDAHLGGATPDYTAEYRTRLGKYNWRWILARGQVAERNKAGEPLRIAGTVADIDACKLQEEQSRHLAHHDILTGVPNRLLCGDRLHPALLAAQREEHRMALIFFVLLPRVAGTGDARKVAEDILRALNRPFMTEGFSLSISASLGVAVYPDCALDADSLLRCADAGMYAAKLHGRGRVAAHAGSERGPVDLREFMREAA